MNEVVLDIETQNTFREAGFPDSRLLKVSIVGIFSYETEEFLTFMEDELSQLWPHLEKADRIIGYNIKHFDMPVLKNYYGGNILNFPLLDIMEHVKNSLGFRLRLDNIAKSSLGVGKSGDGLQAVEYWKAGEIEKLREYCLDDVKITRDVYEFGKQHGKLHYSDLGKKKEFAVDFQPPADLGKLKPAVNFTLPF